MECDDHWILDANISADEGLFGFCPVNLNDDGEPTDVVVGVTLVTDWPESGVVVGIMLTGDEANLHQWMYDHPDVMEKFHARLKAAQEKTN